MFPVYYLLYNNLPLTNNYAYIADVNMCQHNSHLMYPLHLCAIEFVIIPHSPHCLFSGPYSWSTNGLECLDDGNSYVKNMLPFQDHFLKKKNLNIIMCSVLQV